MAPSQPRGATTADKGASSHGGKDRDRDRSTASHATTKSARASGAASAAATVGSSSLKDVIAANDALAHASSSGGGGTNGGDLNGGIAWQTLPTPVLHAYRHAYRLPTPAAFSHGFNQIVLSNPGIGLHSPTMARRVEKRRVGKDELAKAVRKNFNGAGIQEGDVVTEFLYKVRWQDKNFRMRFTPQRNR